MNTLKLHEKSTYYPTKYYTFRFPPKIASSLEPAFGGGDVADAGGVTLDALGGVCVGELALPADGDSIVGEDMLIGDTFKDFVRPAF